ncbi:MAG: hypothetical protein ABSA96_01485 [Candidatus Acidiferrales bacterium]
MGEFTHQEIGIEQENDETDFNERPPNWSQFSGIAGARVHLPTIAKLNGAE